VASSTGTWKGPFGYAGSHGYQEDGSGYKLLGHRLYDPQVGRFLTRDPIQDGRNWYAYCENNPVTGYDAEGLAVWHLAYALLKYLAKEVLEEILSEILGLALENVLKKFPGIEREAFHREVEKELRRLMKGQWYEKYIRIEQPYKKGKESSGKYDPRPDIVIIINGRPRVIIDWKTGKSGFDKKQRDKYAEHVFGGRAGLFIEVKTGSGKPKLTTWIVIGGKYFKVPDIFK
jgi:RHS repeat-associated protein